MVRSLPPGLASATASSEDSTLLRACQASKDGVCRSRCAVFQPTGLWHIMDPPSLRPFVGKTESPRVGRVSGRAQCLGSHSWLMCSLCLRARQRQERITSLPQSPATSTKLTAVATVVSDDFCLCATEARPGHESFRRIHSSRLLFAPWHGELVWGPSPWNLVREHASACTHRLRYVDILAGVAGRCPSALFVAHPERRKVLKKLSYGCAAAQQQID